MRTTIARRPGMGWRRVLGVVASGCVAAATTAAPVVPNAAGYVWDSVAIGGGGFVTAIVPSRSEHRFTEGAPFEVRIGYASGATAVFNGQEINVNAARKGGKTAVFTAGETP